MKKLLIIGTIMCSALIANADNTVVAFTSLPQGAQDFTKTNFKDKQIASAQIDTSMFGLITDGYEVNFSDGTKLEFDGNGNWTEISATTSQVPTDLVPEKILQYVKTNFNSSAVIAIEKKSYGYKVELKTKQELKFDPNYIFIGLD